MPADVGCDERSPTLLQGRLSPRLLITASAWLSRLIGLAVQVLSVRYLLSSLGGERYAVFALLASLLPWYALADIGIGFAVQNSVTERQAKDIPFREIVVSGLAAGLAALLGCAVLIVVLAPWLGPQFLVQFHDLAVADRARLFLYSGLLMAAATTTAIGAKCWYAVKKGHIANLINIGGSVALMAGLVAASMAPVLRTLEFYVCLFAAVPALTGLLSTGIFWRSYRLSVADFDQKAIGPIWLRARPFALNTVLVIAVLEVKYIIMSQLVVSRDIVFYNVVDRVFLGAYLLYSAALQVLWPEVTELSASNQWDRIFRHIRQYVLLGAIFMLSVTVAFIGLKPWILSFLSPKEPLAISNALILSFGIMYIQFVWGATFGTVLQGISQLKSFNAAVFAQALISMPMQWVLTIRFGLFGLILGVFLSACLTTGWAVPWFVFRHRRLALKVDR